MKFREFEVKGKKFLCTLVGNTFIFGGYLTAYVYTGNGNSCARTVISDGDRQFFTWNGKNVYIDELMEVEV